MKGLASVANTYGKPRVGAEAFTGCRGWVDHPYLLKGMGDEAFCNGVSHYVIHLSAHQPYDRMKPGLTHRRWGQHFNRHQTWWEFSKPYFDYVARCQFLLQQGRRVVDVACLYHEGAPLNFNDIKFEMPTGYDYDFCSPEIVQRMQVKDGRIHLPTGVSYRYLVLPRSGRLTLPTARKIAELREAGASVYLQSPIVGTPGLEGYPEANEEVKRAAVEWPLIPQGGLDELFASDNLKPDFEGEGLKWIHRRTESADLYFVANTKPESIRRQCTFRIAGKTPELWNPETGEFFALPGARQDDGRTTAVLHFEPAQSWFVVFRDRPPAPLSAGNPFPSRQPVQDITGPWTLSFDPDWGTKETVTLDELSSWSEHSDPLVKYYSGTATYRKVFDVPESVDPGREVPTQPGPRPSRGHGACDTQRQRLRHCVETTLSRRRQPCTQGRTEQAGDRGRQHVGQPHDRGRAASAGRQVEGLGNADRLAGLVQGRPPQPYGALHLHNRSPLREGESAHALRPSRSGANPIAQRTRHGSIPKHIWTRPAYWVPHVPHHISV